MSSLSPISPPETFPFETVSSAAISAMPSVLANTLTSLVKPVANTVEMIAATELMPRFRRVAVERKQDGSVVTEADRAVEAALILALPKIVDCPC